MGLRKEQLDGLGAGALLAVTLLLAVNQIVVKEVATGVQPVFLAGLRSALAIVFVGGWLWYRGLLSRLHWADLGPGLLMGAIFALEFLCLFTALDLTTVGRASVLFYSMPLWMAGLAHFILPNERITALRAFGLVLAFLGTAWAILTKAPAGQASLTGDILALVAAVCWAGSAVLARATRLRAAGPEAQLFWMVVVSAPILLLAAPLFGPLIREVTALHWVFLVLQASVVVTGGFICWLWLLSVYPASAVASFSFLSPVFAMALGHLILGEALVPGLMGATCLIGVGILLINRKV
jgi:drug/metabolite transporter (DMT)-like permease